MVFPQIYLEGRNFLFGVTAAVIFLPLGDQ